MIWLMIYLYITYSVAVFSYILACNVRNGDSDTKKHLKGIVIGLLWPITMPMVISVVISFMLEYVNRSHK
jgi:heme/copper-type cytochrome/quinol oxidase subunit 2